MIMEPDNHKADEKTSFDSDNDCCSIALPFEDGNDYMQSVRQLTWLPADELPRLILLTVLTASDPNNRVQFETLYAIIDKIASGVMPPPQVTMRYEMLRLCTLRTYPKGDKPYVLKLAQAGFYYASKSDEVVCYCCARRKDNWTVNDIPMTVHKALSPNCIFLSRNHQVNVPISNPNGHEGSRVPSVEDPETRTQTNNALTEASVHYTSTQYTANQIESNTSSGNAINQFTQSVPLQEPAHSSHRPQRPTETQYNSQQRSLVVNNMSNLSDETVPSRHGPSELCGIVHSAETAQFTRNNNANINAISVLESVHQSSDISRPQVSENSKMNSINFSRPPEAETSSQDTLAKHPKFAEKKSRLDSFMYCSSTIAVPVAALVDAGFFYAGYGDSVRCFYCAIGLRNWTEEDEPWHEHARWSKHCLYLLKCKGQEFVNRVQLALQYTSELGSANSQGETVDQFGQDVDRILLTSAAQRVLEMGYKEAIVRRAILSVLQTSGEERVTAEEILEKVFTIESMEQNTAFTNASMEQGGLLKKEQQCKAKANAHGRGHDSTHSNGNASITKKDIAIKESKTEDKLNFYKLKKENDMLKQQFTCFVCKKAAVGIVFLPCGHLVTCENCAPTVELCVICKKKIQGTARTYPS